jgi:hypothetical protein
MGGSEWNAKTQLLEEKGGDETGTLSAAVDGLPESLAEHSHDSLCHTLGGASTVEVVAPLLN